MIEGKAVFTVGQFLRHLNEGFRKAYSVVALRGEVVSLTSAASGHWYFGLKDEGAQIRAVMFRQRNVLTGFFPKQGDQVEVMAQLAVYEQRGDLQLIVESMRLAGQGGLYEQFMRLKNKLTQEGLFEVARKKALPRVPFSLGVVTSPQAAALADVKQALMRRCPHVSYSVYHTAVQGQVAEVEIAQALRKADAAGHDVLILCRGGGSLEDLWAFNTEGVVRAVAQCVTPIVVGVGHETDVTLAEFAADVRAATPTAAAELISPSTRQLLEQVHGLHKRLEGLCAWRLQALVQRVDRADLALLSPRDYVDGLNSRLNMVHAQLRGAMQGVVLSAGFGLQAPKQQLQAELETGLLTAGAKWHAAFLRLKQGQDRTWSRRLACVEQLSGVMEAIAPERTLERGFAYLQREGPDGGLVSSVAQVDAGQQIQARLKDGTLALRVLSQADKPAKPRGSKSR